MSSEDFDFFDIDYDRGYWTTKAGDRLKIELMESNHIYNCIKLLKRKLKEMDEDYKMAYEDYMLFKIKEFENEIKKRKLYKRHILDIDFD